MIDASLTLNQLAQREGGVNVLAAMTGAKNFVKSDEENFVSFRFTAKAKNKANYIKITLNAMDTYDVEFGYIRGMNYTVRSVSEGLYDDMLKKHFETETGLYLTF
ncbi:MAG: hypothetical protein K0U20_08595 [Proteobacteria bacterium]|nr:hypothetical protein [Pseudomonadota bacterium]